MESEDVDADDVDAVDVEVVNSVTVPYAVNEMGGVPEWDCQDCQLLEALYPSYA